MSGTVNKVMLIGYLGDDVKMHYFDDQNCVARFPLATHESYTSKKTNERITNTEWHNIVVRNKAAEICEKYLSKGDKVYIEGRIKTKKWTDDKGLDRYTTEIACTDFTFLSSKPEAQQQRPQTPHKASEKSTNDLQTQTPEHNAFSSKNEDDLPF